MNQKDIKNHLFNILTPYLKEKGYKPYLTGSDPGYALIDNNEVIHFFFNFYKNGSIRASSIQLTIYDVEDIILKIDLPTYGSLDSYRKKEKYHLSTVNHRRITKPTTDPITSQKEVEEYAQSYIRYLENEGKEFIEKYHYLPNILTEMDRLENEGLYWKEILSGGPDYLLRGIIISRLCNDPKIEVKISFVNSLLSDLEEWQPYWKKLIELLPSISPKFKR